MPMIVTRLPGCAQGPRAPIGDAVQCPVLSRTTAAERRHGGWSLRCTFAVDRASLVDLREQGQAPRVEQRITLVTLGVTDLDASRRFYLDGLGWHPLLDAGEAVFLQVGPGLVLSLYGREDLARDAGTAAGPVEPPPITLAHNVAAEGEVQRGGDDLRAEIGRAHV